MVLISIKGQIICSYTSENVCEFVLFSARYWFVRYKQAPDILILNLVTNESLIAQPGRPSRCPHPPRPPRPPVGSTHSAAGSAGPAGLSSWYHVIRLLLHSAHGSLVEREQNKKVSKSNSSHGSSITVIYCDCVWAGLSRVDSEKEEGIVDMVVQINLDNLILVMTARKQLHLSQRAIWLTPIITIHNKRPGRTAVVVSLSCQASNQHWHPAGSAGQ